MEPVSVQVITYAPTVFRHCQHCEVAIAGIGLGERIHRAEAANALPEDLLQDFQQVSDFVHALLERHGGRVSVSVIDAASIEGVWKSLRYGVRRYPAVVVDGRDRIVGPDFAAIGRVVEQRVGEHMDAARDGRKGAA